MLLDLFSGRVQNPVPPHLPDPVCPLGVRWGAAGPPLPLDHVGGYMGGLPRILCFLDQVLLGQITQNSPPQPTLYDPQTRVAIQASSMWGGCPDPPTTLGTKGGRSGANQDTARQQFPTEVILEGTGGNSGVQGLW
ncbi:Ccnl1 protein [Platysternon megacephalum]|uniref:Ccnl1 protein n=1 Tax=Platysternon megacephalum TaxID=55544 RepID=A0A4D9DIB4_9SAUR|nr:pyruvate dehydrogenase [Platysternon megacephalum]TFJ97078.1 Ccnl1 protein [Platysternon megacephalum]